jgi:hypothetical protein
VQERLGETLLLIARTLGFAPPLALPAIFTYNPRGRTAPRNLSAHATLALRQTLAPDIALYERGLQRFEELLHGVARVESPLRCAWRNATCWDKSSTVRRTAFAGKTAAAGARRANTTSWPIAAVEASPLWQRRRRRQDTLCAASCKLHIKVEGSDRLPAGGTPPAARQSGGPSNGDRAVCAAQALTGTVHRYRDTVPARIPYRRDWR